MAQMSDLVEEELIYGARRRERVWKVVAALTSLFGVAGCLAAAAIMHGVIPCAGKRVGIVLSGGNVDLASFARFIAPAG